MSDFATMGDEMEGDVLGDEDFATVGARRAFRARGPRLSRGRMVSYGPGRPTPALMPPRPAWRNELAPGVAYPGEGLQPLPMTPSANAGVFNATNQTIAFVARPQVPFRIERVLTSARRTGAAGVLILATSFFVGRQNQLVQTGSFDIEFFTQQAFGVRLSLDPAEPGIEITINCSATPAVAGTDTVAVSILLLGRSIR